MDYKKPQSTLVQGGKGIYPLTTADQVILADGSRLEKDGKISADSAANSADSAKLGGKAPEYYIQPRNLLDNSDFRNPVNQRGKTSYSGNIYTIDRWALWWDGIAAGTLSITEKDSITATKSLYQNIIGDTNKTYTFAVMLETGLRLVCGKPKESVTDGVLLLMDSNGMIQPSIINGGKMYWAALYEGSYTADTLPPYVPKGYAAELAECRLYYRPQQMYCLYCYSGGYTAGVSFEPMRPGVIPTPVNVKAQTMEGDAIAGETNIVVIRIDRISHVANTNFTYGNYYRVYSDFSSDL